MVNRVTLIGNLGKDPEVRRLESGAVVAQFSLATNENYKDKDGNWQTQTEWHNIVVWRAGAEQAERNFKKGSTVYIEGKLAHRKYTDTNNVERYITEIVANYMRGLDKREGGGGGYQTAPISESNEPTNVRSNTQNDAPVGQIQNDQPTSQMQNAPPPAAEEGDLPF
jgi:single-strand DNA-binding protein